MIWAIAQTIRILSDGSSSKSIVTPSSNTTSISMSMKQTNSLGQRNHTLLSRNENITSRSAYAYSAGPVLRAIYPTSSSFFSPSSSSSLLPSSSTSSSSSFSSSFLPSTSSSSSSSSYLSDSSEIHQNQKSNGSSSPSSSFTSSLSSSPTMTILTLICKDEIQSGRYYCCAVLLASLLSGSSIPEDLMKFRIFELYCKDPKECSAQYVSTEKNTIGRIDDNVRTNLNKKNKINTQNKTKNTETDKSETLQSNNIKEMKSKKSRNMVDTIIRTFKLNKLLSPKGFDDILFNFHPLENKLFQPLQLSFLRQKCEKEMLVVRNPESALVCDINDDNNDSNNNDDNNNSNNNNNANNDSNNNDSSNNNNHNNNSNNDNNNEHGEDEDIECHTTLVATDILKNILSEASSFKQTSRTLFLSAAAIAARAISLHDSIDESDHIELDRSVTTLLSSRSPSFTVHTKPTVRILPQTNHAVSHIDIGTNLFQSRNVRSGIRTGCEVRKGLDVKISSGSTTSFSSFNHSRNPNSHSSSTVSTLIRSLCVGLLLTGDVRTVSTIVYEVMNRRDISLLCDLIDASMEERHIPLVDDNDDDNDNDNDDDDDEDRHKNTNNKKNDSDNNDNGSNNYDKNNDIKNIDNQIKKNEENFKRNEITDNEKIKIKNACQTVFEFLIEDEC